MDPHPNFERICTLHRHFERALQCLPCPQSVQHGWKGMVMAHELYALITIQPFCLPTNPGATATYICSQTPGQPINNAPLTRTEQASIDSLFNRRKAYYLSMQNIKRVCFTALDASVDDASKVLNDPAVRGWHAGMRVIDILDQLSATYGQPTSAALEANDHIFRSPTLAADPPEVLFRRIEECAETALLGKNPYTNKQLIMNAIRLLLSTGLYTRAFEDWDQLTDASKHWIELCQIIQDAFQRRLNASTPTSGHQGYAPALPFQTNAFNVLAADDSEEDTANNVPTQMAAMTYQSQLTAATVTNASQRMDQYVQTLTQQQEQLHQTQHQIMEQLAALTLNHGEGGWGVGQQRRPHPPPPTPFAPIQFGRHNFGNRGGQGRGRGRGRGRGLPAFTGGHTIPPMSIITGRKHTFPVPHTPGSRGYFTSMPQVQINVPYSNTTKQYANWNACYSCGFDVEDSHTSQTCPLHLRQQDHVVNFT
jgi:hypothetical protein